MFFTWFYPYLNPHYSFLRVPKHRYTNTGLNDAKICQNMATRSSGTGTTLTVTSTSYPLPVGTGTGLSGIGTDCPLHHGTDTTPLVPVPPTGFCPKMRDFGIFTHFSSTNLLQYVPYQKSTMESTQNNSKSGLESMKTLFSQVRAFPQNPNQIG